MKKKALAMIPYLIAMILLFYVLPFLIKDTGSAMGVLLVGIPRWLFCYSIDLRNQTFV